MQVRSTLPCPRYVIAGGPYTGCYSVRTVILDHHRRAGRSSLVPAMDTTAAIRSIQCTVPLPSPPNMRFIS